MIHLLTQILTQGIALVNELSQVQRTLQDTVRCTLTSFAPIGGLCYNRDVDHEKFMREAIAEATLAFQKGDVPVGAVAVRDGQIIGRGHNRKEELKDPTAHAEMIALQEAARTLGGWRLTKVTLYCTMEPCPMCAGAMIQARLPRLVYAVDDPKAGAAGSVMDLLCNERLNHRVEVIAGVLAEEAEELTQRFFQRLRI
jgi:tRNA(adenine34) deaminase